jgi:hypothetical protein
MFSNTPKKVVFFKKTTGKVNSEGSNFLYRVSNLMHAHKKLARLLGTGIEIDRLFLKIDNSPWDDGRSFYKNYLFIRKTFPVKSEMHVTCM